MNKACLNESKIYLYEYLIREIYLTLIEATELIGNRIELFMNYSHRQA